jgi:transposase
LNRSFSSSTTFNGGRKPAVERIYSTASFSFCFILHSGVAWRDTPAKYDLWSTVYGRFWEWRNAKVFEDI